MFNLTLDEDNVYYANGVLVANCADALALTFAADVGPALDMFAARLTPPRQAERRYHPFARGNGRR